MGEVIGSRFLRHRVVISPLPSWQLLNLKQEKTAGSLWSTRPFCRAFATPLKRISPTKTSIF
jgi:hypothetical protein